MTITVVADNRMGVLSRLAVALGRADMKIERQSRSEADAADRVTYTFEVSGAQPQEALSSALKGISHVHTVLFETENAAKTVETAPAYPLQPYLDDLIRAYPDVVGRVKTAQARLSLDGSGCLELGRRVGESLVANGTVKPVRTDSVGVALERLVLPAVKPFSLAKVTGDTLSVTVNPFAQGVSSQGVNCYFLTGLASGLLQSAVPTATVSERACKAAGDVACTFVASAH